MKAILAIIVASAILLAGCASDSQAPEYSPTEQQGSNGSPADLGGDQVFGEELDSYDAELEELEALVNDSNFEEIEFVELDESTFE
ncbi:MAG: hypothetical protein NUV67_03880 [archaeon]|nr:hypothetical protein [archaeon]